jgi:hypothetical protein
MAHPNSRIIVAEYAGTSLLALRQLGAGETCKVSTVLDQLER